MKSCVPFQFPRTVGARVLINSQLRPMPLLNTDDLILHAIQCTIDSEAAECELVEG